MKRFLTLLNVIYILSAILFSIFLAPACVLADSGKDDPEYQEYMRDLKQAAAEKRLEESRETVEEAYGVDEKSTFTPHHLNYAIIGKNNALTQISFKYRLGRDWNTYLAFTNVVKWDIYESSNPYYDINFKPEIFYRFTPELEDLVSVDVGFWHESNGRDEEESRSWDQLFARFNTLFEINGMALAWETHLYYELNTGGTNEDIGDYLGWWDTAFYLLNILPTEKFNIDLEFYIWSGESGIPFKQGQFRTGLIYKMENAVFQPSLYVQYFNGYGEVMADYDVRTEDWRIGLVFLY